MSSMRDMYVGIHFKDEATKAIEKIDRKMDDAEDSIIGIGKQLDKSEDGFKTMGKVGIQATDKIEDGFKDAEKEAKDLNKEVRNSDSALDGLKRTALGIGGTIAGIFAVDKVKDFAVSAIETAASTQALNSQFEQVFGDLEDTASNSMNKIANDTGILPTRLQSSFTQMAAFAKTTGADTADALSLTERATKAAADSAAFYDRSIEDVTDNLQSFLKGNYENDAALGISATETTRNAKANELYGQSFKDLDEAQKQLTLLAMVEDGNKLSGALGQASRESGGFENRLGNVKQAWADFKSSLATPMLDSVTVGLGKLTNALQNVDAEALGQKIKSGFETAKNEVVPVFSVMKTGFGWIKDNGPAIIAVTAGIASGLVAFKVVTTISAGVSALSAALAVYRTAGLAAAAAQLGLNTAMLASPITWVAVGIGTLVAAGIYLWKNWDTVKEKTIGLWGALRENPIVNFVTKPIQNLVNAGIWLWQNFDTVKEKAGQLWQRLLDNPMAALVVGPIGGLIAAGITLYQNWDTVKTKASELWTKTQEVFGGIYDWGVSKISPVVGFFKGLYNNFVSFKNALSNFKLPDWVSTIGSKIGGGVFKGLFDGSHATGLAKVPFDGYRAELHKDEAVLTAQQSNALRGAGILRENSDGTPELNMETSTQQSTESQKIYNSTNDTNNNYSTSDFNINVPISVMIDGNQSDVEKMIRLLKSILPVEVRKTIEKIILGEFEALEG